MPSETRPVTITSRWLNCSRAWSMSRMIGVYRRYMRRAASVGVMPCGPRSKSFWFSSASIFEICMLSAGCTMFSRFAARVTEPSSKSAMKYWICLRSISQEAQRVGLKFRV